MKLSEMFSGNVDRDGFFTNQLDISFYLSTHTFMFKPTKMAALKKGVRYKDDLNFKKNVPVTQAGSLKVKFCEVWGNFNVSKTGVSNFEGFPKFTNGQHSLFINNSKITSLIGVADKIVGPVQITLSGNTIKEGGLGLILIKGLLQIGDVDKTEPFKIISKYIGQPELIYDCQAELIENGFEEYAKL